MSEVALFPHFLGCGGTFSSLNGSFASPGYPTWDYPSGQRCRYEIRVPTDKRIVLTIQSFNLQIRSDYLRIQQVTSGRIVDVDVLTGTGIDGRRFTSVENVLILLFSSDGSGRDRGFAVSYHTIELGKYSRLTITVICMVTMKRGCATAKTMG